MYLLIPIGIFVLALGGLAYLVWRKFVYLKKLSPEAISNPPATLKSFWSELFPEPVVFFKSIRWREYWVTISGESEKLLRKIRLLFLRVESLIHNLSLKLKKNKEAHEELLEQEEMQVESKEEAAEIKRDPKEEEQYLIMEIAKNPKDPLLYLRLGDIYLKTGDKENARMSFETVLQLDPENWYAKKKVGELPVRPE